MPSRTETARGATHATVHLVAITRNFCTVASVANADAFAVVKANAYGHGAVAVARALAPLPRLAGFAVAQLDEGVQLRGAGIAAPILVMGAVLGESHSEYLAYDLIPMVSRLTDLERFAALGVAAGVPVGIHLKVDTGMRRLGIDEAELPAALKLLTKPGLVLDGLCTHLACADLDDPTDLTCYTVAQLRRFAAVRTQVADAGWFPSCVHVANSSAALRFDSAGGAGDFSHVRVGIALYGNGSCPAGVTLLPALSLTSEIVHIRKIAAGDGVSYGARWVARQPSTLAIVPIGYGDGYSRLLSGRAEVLIAGTRCPVVGTISMDMIVVDITKLGLHAHIGSSVVLLGAQGSERISVKELAERSGLSEYEITCGVATRVPRVYTPT